MRIFIILILFCFSCTKYVIQSDYKRLVEIKIGESWQDEITGLIIGAIGFQTEKESPANLTIVNISFPDGRPQLTRPFVGHVWFYQYKEFNYQLILQAVNEKKNHIVISLIRLKKEEKKSEKKEDKKDL